MKERLRGAEVNDIGYAFLVFGTSFAKNPFFFCTFMLFMAACMGLLVGPVFWFFFLVDFLTWTLLEDLQKFDKSSFFQLPGAVAVDRFGFFWAETIYQKEMINTGHCIVNQEERL